MKILFAASEIFPYAKTGGLADVAATLPKALNRYADVVSVMPLYSFMDQMSLEFFENFSLTIEKKRYKIEIFIKKEKSGDVFFIKAPLLSDTDGMYGDSKSDYFNNDLRFTLFCRGVVWLAKILHVNLLHLNDWHTALCAYYIKKEENLKIKTVFTIHNLAYQGIFDHTSLYRFGLSNKEFAMDGVEFYGKINLLKAAIGYSDALTTVSPSYAKEILTPEFGCGLEGFLDCHKSKLSGILNGIDTIVFDPKNDFSLIHSYTDSAGKYENKILTLKELGLKDPRKVLFVMVSRLVEQKGVDLLLKMMPEILKSKINCAILGEGEERYVQELQKLSSEHPNFWFYKGYDEALSHRLYSVADFFLMPSRFEPCGLSQFIAMRYGAIPIVHAVGGLKDSVFEDTEECGQGILFSKYNKSEFLQAILRAKKLKKEQRTLLMNHNMQCDFSFDKSAQSYYELYKTL